MLQHTLSVKEAAGFLKVQPRTVRNWIALGKLPASKIGRIYVIPVDEVGKMVTPAASKEHPTDMSRFRTLLRSRRKIDKQAYLADFQAELESARKRNC
jgi:excisionase family DNA binding protein